MIATMQETQPQTDEREAILNALATFIKQRSGMDWRNYASNGADRNGIRAYQREAREVTRDLHDARELLAAVRWRAGIDVAALREAFRAFSGRLTWTPRAGGGTLDYCTGQYFPTEYRKAVCAVLASALWDFWRTEVELFPDELRKTLQTNGDIIRYKARRELSRGVARRWFR